MILIETVAQLTDAGFTVISASDADEAIALLDDHLEIELLLTDIQMPGSMDGLCLAHHVRNRWPPVQILVASGLASIRLADLPMRSVVLRKPFSPNGLIAAVSQLSGRPVCRRSGSSR